jgi:integrase
VSEKSKTDHFSNRFKKVKKALGFGKDYGIYSFRHTAALDLYNTFTKNGLTHSEAVSKLMPIIGHTSEKTTEKYLRDVGALLPKDYGEFYTLNF